MAGDKKKVDRRVLYTKMFLRESLLSLMREKPISKITASELCRHAGMNRNTFYAHYDSPEDLLRSIEEEFYEQVRRSMDLALKSGGISPLITEICEAIYENRDLCSVIFCEFGDKDFLKRIIGLAHDRTIAEWRSAGVTGDEEQTELLYSYSVGGSVAAIEKWIWTGMKKSPQEIALFIKEASYGGLRGFIGGKGL